MTRRARLIPAAALLLAFVAPAVRGGQQYTSRRPGQMTIYWESTNLANAADTNYVGTTLYTLPAGTLVTNGDELLLEWWFSLSAAVSTRTYTLNLGATAFSAASGFTGGLNLGTTTAAASALVGLTATVRRLSATTYSVSWAARWQNSSAIQGSTIYATGSITWANSLTIQAAAKDGASNAAAITLNEFRVTYRPAP